MGKSEVTKKAALKTNSSSDKTTLPLSQCCSASRHYPCRWWVVMQWPDNWSCTMPLIAEDCLVPFFPGAKGNNGLMEKISQAVTSFGFRMCFTGLRVWESDILCSVCVCVHVALLGDKFKRDELSEFYGIFHTNNCPPLPLCCDRVMSHGHLGHYNTLDSQFSSLWLRCATVGGRGHHLGSAVKTEGCPLTVDRSTKLNVTQIGASN